MFACSGVHRSTIQLVKFFSLTAILFFSLIGTATSIACIETKECSCNSRLAHPGEKFTYYEFQCPPSLPDTGGAVVNVRENDTRIQIECHESTYFNSTLFAKIDAGNITWIDIKKHCPLPRNESFEKVIEKLTATKPLALAFERMQLTTEPLSKDYFKGLDKLQGLSLRFNKLQELDEDVFANTPALTMINLQDNKIQLKPNMFKYTPKLNELDISVNGIRSLPDGIFSNLTNLRLLFLWNNRLEYLNERTFRGLNNLTVLQLAINEIESIAVGTFTDLTKLTNLSLTYNQIADIPTNLFAENKLLEEILLEYNPHLTLSDYALANLPNLKTVGMSSSNLSSIPANLFNGSTSLRVLRLDQNQLQTLPDRLFEKLGDLAELNLGKNLMELISNFDGLHKLEKLHLDHNALTRIDNKFEKLSNLAVVKLEHNYITQIDDSAFPASLRRLSLAYNRYNFESSNPFGACVNLELLDLSHNLITAMRNDLFLNAVRLKELILNNNLINEVDFRELSTVSGSKIFLRNNHITNINFHSAKILANHLETNQSTEVYLKGNPIKCDCRAYDLALYIQDKLHPNLKTFVELISEEIICDTPKELEHNLVEELHLEKLSCPLEESKDCPHKCFCSYEPHEDKIVYDCAFKNLTQIPDLVQTKRSYNRTKVLLEGNALRTGPSPSLIGWDNVTELYLSQNMIQNMTWVPSVLQVLMLDNNNLSRIPNSVLQSLNSSSLKHFSLDHNPWTCDCNAQNLTNFIRQHSRLIETKDVRCVDLPHSLLVDLDKHDLCKEWQPLYLALVIVFIFLITAILAALYYRHQEDIKVWLYARNLCLWWVTEEELDKNKKYDAFISFSHKDEDFVTEKLLPVLEGGPNPYKLCFHERDWIGGELITDQIIRSINDSRRTIVVLSSNFLESVWGRMEFKTAHTQAMNEGRARVIVILLGDIDIKNLDEDLKSYLRTNTYVKWDEHDPWFWNKLSYALPHSKRNGSQE